MLWPDFYTLSVIVFAIVLAGLFWKDRRNVERQSIVFLRKTQRGRRFITNLGKRFPRFWLATGTLAVAVGFFMSLYILYFLADLALTNITAEQPVPGLALVLPSPSAETVSVPGIIGVPFWYWIISIALLVLVHEGLHGVMAARERVRIKSLGWGALFVIPLAFVEPDEKQLSRKPALSQLRVFASGSFANFLLALLSFGLLYLLSTSAFVPAGIAYRGVIEGYPAADANLTGVIISINNHTIATVDDFREALSEIGPGETITIHTMVFENGSQRNLTFSLVTAPAPDNSSRGFIGIARLSQYMEMKHEYRNYAGLLNFLGGLLFFLFIINFGVGAANLMPLGPLDGGRMWSIALKKIAPRHHKPLFRAISAATLLLLVFNLGLSFL